jgi:CheY-like chemotaxis protein
MAAEPASSVAERAIRPEPRTVRILVVDDDDLVRKALRRALKGYEVTLLSSAKEAAQAIGRGDRFDLIICDLMMPEVTGMDLHEEISRLAPAMAAQMIFLTGGAVTTQARAFVAAVANRVIEKPFDVGALRSLVESRTRG